MKKVILITVIILNMLTGSNLFALDVMAGVKSGYYLWRPYYKDFSQSGTTDIETGRGMLYGPVVSVIINPEWSFSASGLFGKQTSFWSLKNGDMMFGNNELNANSTWYADTTRIDLDFALSYRLSNNIKVFAGYKYQYMETDYQATFIAEDYDSGQQSAYDGAVVVRSPAHGPALGLGFSQILGDNLFFSTNLSVIYLFSKVEWHKNEWNSYTPDGAGGFNEGFFSADNMEFNTYQIGVNIEPSFGSSINKNLIMVIGGRFQYMFIKFTEEPVTEDVTIADKDDGMHDLIYGGFVSVIYSF